MHNKLTGFISSNIICVKVNFIILPWERLMSSVCANTVVWRASDSDRLLSLSYISNRMLLLSDWFQWEPAVDNSSCTCVSQQAFVGKYLTPIPQHAKQPAPPSLPPSVLIMFCLLPLKESSFLVCYRHTLTWLLSQGCVYHLSICPSFPLETLLCLASHWCPPHQQPRWMTELLDADHKEDKHEKSKGYSCYENGLFLKNALKEFLVEVWKGARVMVLWVKLTCGCVVFMGKLALSPNVTHQT